MTRDQAKDYVKGQLENYLQGKGIHTRQPFKCLNPDHPDNKPSMSFDPRRNKCKCFSCNADYDTFDLISIDYGVSGRELFEKAYSLYGLHIDGSTGYTPQGTPKEDFREYIDGVANQQQPTQPPLHNTQSELHNQSYTTSGGQSESKPKPDFTKAIERAHAALMQNPAALAHFTDRGLTLDTIQAHKLGYSPEGVNSLLKAYPDNMSQSRKAGLYNYIFPIIDSEGKCSYFISEISNRNEIDAYNGKYNKIKGLSASLYNEQYLTRGSHEVLYICEGIFDALSIEQLGGHAIALTGTGHNKLLKLCRENGVNSAFVIALDEDEAGKKATAALTAGFEELGLIGLVSRPKGGKDANEILQKDAAALEEYVRATTDKAAGLKAAKDQEIKAEYMKKSAKYLLSNFINSIAATTKACYFSTGFSALDSILDGGLYAGLYCIGAISSLGKTTFCLQVADNLARAGKDVLIFSLEMAKEELIAKSISRHTLLENWKLNGSAEKAKTTRGILTGSRYASYSQAERSIINAALSAYEDYAEHIYISEGIGNIGVEEIRQKVEEHIRATGSEPAILIDYLQIIAPADPRSTDKQNTDKAVLELKRMSRDYNIPVIGISSFNRDNYTAPVNLASFKESGAIEYSSDVLLGLQYIGMDFLDGEKDADRAKRVREVIRLAAEAGKVGQAQKIQVKVLKNRNGSKGECLLDFYPMFNYFEDSQDQTIEHTKAESSPSKGNKKQENPREQLKAQLANAYWDIIGLEDRESVTLEELADQLEISKRSVKNRLKDFTSIFEIEGENVRLRDAAALAQAQSEDKPEPEPEPELTLFGDEE